MVEIPPEMLTRDRKPDPHFEDTERLFRRFPPGCLDGAEIAIAAVELPDMSVAREKYGQPEWLLLDDEFSRWGVFAFLVRDLPPKKEIWHEGVIPFSLEARHVPLKFNYPHAEVWVFRDGIHVCKQSQNVDLLDPDFHLRWRESIVFASHIAIAPTERN